LTTAPLNLHISQPLASNKWVMTSKGWSTAVILFIVVGNAHVQNLHVSFSHSFGAVTSVEFDTNEAFQPLPRQDRALLPWVMDRLQYTLTHHVNIAI
jgi:hypothetical protein